jgi:hypothetical protein
MDYKLSQDEMTQAVLDTIKANRLRRVLHPSADLPRLQRAQA